MPQLVRPPFLMNAGFGAGGSSAYVSPTPSDYDGSTMGQTKASDLTGMADGKQGTISFWVRIDAGNGTTRLLLQSGTDMFDVFVDPSNKFGVYAQNAATAAILDIRTAVAYTAGATWLNFLSSWNLASAGARHIYINDVSDLAQNTFTDDTINYTNTAWGHGSSTIPSYGWNGCISESFFHPLYIDLSVTANRRKFISATGKPVSLGADGSTPLGVQPLIYGPTGDLSGTGNKGSGGAFTTTGTLGSCSSNPST